MRVIEKEAIPDNYEPSQEPSNYTAYADGDYQVKGFTWKSVETSTGNPMLVMRKDNKLGGRLNFNLNDGQAEGPFMSIFLSDMPLLAKAFGINTPIPPSETQAGLVSQFMKNMENDVNNSGRTTKVTVKGGFVNHVQGMEVPHGYFYFHLVDVRGRGQDCQPFVGKGESEYFWFVFQVDAGEGGSETPFKGSTFDSASGLGLDIQDGYLIWDKTQAGKWTTSAANIRKLFNATTGDILSTGFDIADKSKFVPFWKTHIEAHTLKGSRVKDAKSGRINLAWDTIEVVQGFKGETKPVTQQQPETVDEKGRKVFVKIINTLTNGKGAIEEDGSWKFTPEGAANFAKPYISPLKNQNLIQGTNLGNITFDDMDKIIKTLPKDNIQELISEFTVIGVRLDEFGSGFEESPF
jgi:hypothetical protein